MKYPLLFAAGIFIRKRNEILKYILDICMNYTRGDM